MKMSLKYWLPLTTSLVIGLIIGGTISALISEERTMIAVREAKLESQAQIMSSVIQLSDPDLQREDLKETLGIIAMRADGLVRYRETVGLAENPDGKRFIELYDEAIVRLLGDKTVLNLTAPADPTSDAYKNWSLHKNEVSKRIQTSLSKKAGDEK